MPRLVNPVIRLRSLLEFSPGTGPRTTPARAAAEARDLVHRPREAHRCHLNRPGNPEARI